LTAGGGCGHDLATTGSVGMVSRILALT